MGIRQVLRARLGSGQDTPDNPGERAIRVAHSDPRSFEELGVLLDQRFVDRPMLRIELVKQLDENPVAAALEFRAESLVDLGRETLIFPLELLNQVLIQ